MALQLRPNCEYCDKDLPPNALDARICLWMPAIPLLSGGEQTSGEPTDIEARDPTRPSADNYLIDIKFGIIMDVEASRAIRQSEVGASQTMIERTEKTFGIKPDWLVADTAYGAAQNLHFLVDVMKSSRLNVPSSRCDLSITGMWGAIL